MSAASIATVEVLSNVITEPLQFPFFVRALLISIVLGALSGHIGTFVVLRRMSYLGHGTSQAVIGGAAVGLMAGMGLPAALLLGAATAGAAVTWLMRRLQLPSDAAVGVVSTTMFAAGVTIVSAVPTLDVDLQQLLLGSVLGVTWADTVATAVVAAVVSLVLIRFQRQVAADTFDPAGTVPGQLPPQRVALLFNVTAAVVVAAAVETVGLLLVAGMLLVPAAAALQVGRNLTRTLLMAAAGGAAAAAAGLFVSFHADVPTGPAIVLLDAALLLVAAGVAATRR